MSTAKSRTGEGSARPDAVQGAERPRSTEFLRKWAKSGQASGLGERAGAQSHFLDLCRFLEVPSPDDPDSYCFERGLWGIEGGKKFADVWKRGCFAWEYKAPGKNLRAALAQLMQYALPLENPPLLIVSDREVIQIHTHFTGHPSLMHELAHDELRDPRKQALLRSAFLTPNDFRPIQTSSALTADLAGQFAQIADALRRRGEPSFRAAHFLVQCIFCSFAEDIGALPDHVFRRLVIKRQTPTALQRGLGELFSRMQTGGDFGVESIPWFNGGLFKAVDVPRLDPPEVEVLERAASSSWQSIDPSILGTLFERGLDPMKRSQMGAHYTDAATIERLIEPTIRRPLLQEWDGIKREISTLTSERDMLRVRAKGIPSKSAKLAAKYRGVRGAAGRANRRAENLLAGFFDRLNRFRVLDPACGSGNFLFLALKALKDVEHLVNFEAEELGLQRHIPVTGPQNVLGIEVNEYAAELARATVWIGELQWRRLHGYGWKEDPILDPLDHIECRDALINADGSEAAWPAADAVVGNPPFVGDRKMRAELGSAYTEQLRALYTGRVPGGADLVCYWFEKARTAIEANRLHRAGLVATNSIRGGANRQVLDRIVATTRIFEAWSDEPWVNNGAAVRVSLVAFGTSQQSIRLNDIDVQEIRADLTPSDVSGIPDMTTAARIAGNAAACFIGTQKNGQFDVDGAVARAWLQQPNPNGQSSADVLRPWCNGMDVTRRPSDTWIIDFDKRSEADSSLFEAPFAHVQAVVRPTRTDLRRDWHRLNWWLHGDPRPAMKRATARIPRQVITPRVSKHRVFAWFSASVLADSAVAVVARADDTTFGILHSRLHELWSLRMCTWMGKGNDPRYTPTSCFETFPFPAGLTPADTAHQRTETLDGGAVVPAGLPPEVRGHAEAIARAAQRLVALRDAWLNPPEWCERMPEVVPLGLAASPYPDRIVPRPGHEKDLAKRTLTSLYNQRPTWLVGAHRALDGAVASAYGWADYTPAMPDQEVLCRLLALNLQRARQQASAA